MRWLGRSGAIYAWNLCTASEAATIRFIAWSFRQPQRLGICLDGQLVDTRTIVDLQTITLPITLPPDATNSNFAPSIRPPVWSISAWATTLARCRSAWRA